MGELFDSLADHFAEDRLQLVTPYPSGLSDLLSPITFEIGNPRLNRSREITPEVIGCGNFDSFFRDNV